MAYAWSTTATVAPALDLDLAIITRLRTAIAAVATPAILVRVMSSAVTRMF